MIKKPYLIVALWFLFLFGGCYHSAKIVDSNLIPDDPAWKLTGKQYLAQDLVFRCECPINGVVRNDLIILFSSGHAFITVLPNPDVFGVEWPVGVVGHYTVNNNKIIIEVFEPVRGGVGYGYRNLEFMLDGLELIDLETFDRYQLFDVTIRLVLFWEIP